MATGGVSGLALSPIASALLSDDPSTLFPTLGACLFVFGANVGEITDEREYRERAGHGERNGGDGGRWGKDCRVAHGNEGEGVDLIFNGLLSFFRRSGGWRRVRIRLAV